MMTSKKNESQYTPLSAKQSMLSLVLASIVLASMLSLGINVTSLTINTPHTVVLHNAAVRPQYRFQTFPDRPFQTVKAALQRQTAHTANKRYGQSSTLFQSFTPTRFRPHRNLVLVPCPLSLGRRRLRHPLRIHQGVDTIEECRSIPWCFPHYFGVDLSCPHHFHGIVHLRFLHEPRRRHGIMEIRNLFQLPCGRLVGHHRLVLEVECRDVCLEPCLHPTPTGDNLTILRTHEGTIDVTGQILHQRAKAKQILVRFMGLLPRLQQLFLRRARIRCRASLRRAPFRRKSLSAYLLPFVVCGTT